MAPFVDKVMKNNPCVYIKSHPKGTETFSLIEFHFSTTAKDALTAKTSVDAAVVQLTELIQAKGGTVVPTEPED